MYTCPSVFCFGHGYILNTYLVLKQTELTQITVTVMLTCSVYTNLNWCPQLAQKQGIINQVNPFAENKHGMVV